MSGCPGVITFSMSVYYFWNVENENEKGVDGETVLNAFRRLTEPTDVAVQDNNSVHFACALPCGNVCACVCACLFVQEQRLHATPATLWCVWAYVSACLLFSEVGKVCWVCLVCLVCF